MNDDLMTILVPTLLEGAGFEMTWRDQADWLRQNVPQDYLLNAYVQIHLAYEALDDETEEDLQERLMEDLEVLWWALVDPESSTIELHKARIRDRWTKQFPARSDLLEPILVAYAEPHRCYHGVEHISFGLEMMERFWGTPDKELFLAWVMHDVVYDPQGPANEAKSADQAYDLAKELGLNPESRLAIRRAIHATEHKRPADPNNQLEARLLDIDLVRLGLGWSAFQRDTAGIRQEYSWVPDKLFWGNRSRILQQFAARSSLFVTQEARRSEWESRAQDNLQRAILEAKKRASD